MVVDGLIQAMKTLNAEDALRLRLSDAQWGLLAGYLQQHNLRVGDILVRFHDMDRVMYFLESGMLQVYVPDSAPARRPVAILRPGAVVGEPSLFGETPRMAQVEAMSPCVVWALSRTRFEEMAARQPELGIQFLRAIGGVMAERMRANLERGMPVA